MTKTEGLYWVWFENNWAIAEFDGAELFCLYRPIDEEYDADEVIVGPRIGPRDPPQRETDIRPRTPW